MRGEPRLHALFRYCQEHGGSDLHLMAGLEPRIRRRGSLEPVQGWNPLSAGEVDTLLREVVSEAQWQEFADTGDLDFAYGLAGVARFRGNFLKQGTGASAVFRVIPQEILSLEQLALPAAIGKLAHLSRGLVLVTGPTGSGKSTTLAAIIDEINRAYAKHVVTIEDPVEFVHPNRSCVLSQREVGTDTADFSGALRAALRQDADVILVGEMRDLETIALAITAAEMGTLVFGTLHTNGTANTIDRLIDAFPADQQAQVRITLSESLAAVVSQLLVPTADGKGRVAAHEILLRTSALPNVIREGNTPMIRSLIQGGRSDGMQLMDDALDALQTAGTITPRDAYLKATDKARFEAFLDS
ncbi:MAG TPA: type IV pilus twitching motility protein PilT [Thermoanaerobaculia bacterium]|nr:type IV pilus twitching motility protein PilT [Thermoanaerobaculia bacterium]